MPLNLESQVLSIAVAKEIRDALAAQYQSVTFTNPEVILPADGQDRLYQIKATLPNADIVCVQIRTGEIVGDVKARIDQFVADYPNI